MNGEYVTIEDMMACRDRRFAIQQKYLAKYKCPVLSFALNIPGPVKTNKQLHNCFAAATDAINKTLSTMNISVLESIQFNDKTGDELLLCFDGDASLVKNAMTKLEEEHPLGRLYDIDIIGIDGMKLSRHAFRKCLICDCQAQECARSRKHSVEEMQNKIVEMLNEAGL